MKSRGERELLGRFIKCYIGFSRDPNIRLISSSGGIATALLIFMLKEGMIDGALTVKMIGLKPRYFMAREPKDIISAAGSKYLPVKMDRELLMGLAGLRGRYAVVGLPCHIRAVRGLMEESGELRKRIALLIGLFCRGAVSPSGLKVLLYKLNVDEREVKEIRFRGYGWPGRLSINLKDGRAISIPYFDYWEPLYSPYFFMHKPCILCPDMTNEEADISLGDAWLPEILRRDRLGHSIIISRSEDAEKILWKAQGRGFISISEIDAEKIIEAQWRPLFFKKVTLPIRLMLWPHRGGAPTQAGFLNIVCALIQLINIGLSERDLGRSIIKRLPHKLLRLYSFMHAKVERIAWRLNLSK